MKKMLFVIPWSGFYVGVDYSFADAPERAPEGVVALATDIKSKGAEVRVADMRRMLRGNKGNAEKTLNQLWCLCEQFRPDVVGFSFFTARFEFVQQIYAALCNAYEKH